MSSVFYVSVLLTAPSPCCLLFRLQEELKKRGTKTPSRPKKKKKHRNADGELVEGESEEEDGEEEEEEEGETASGNDMAARLKEKEEEIEAEKRAILDNKEMIAEVKRYVYCHIKNIKLTL